MESDCWQTFGAWRYEVAVEKRRIVNAFEESVRLCNGRAGIGRTGIDAEGLAPVGSPEQCQFHIALRSEAIGVEAENMMFVFVG